MHQIMIPTPQGEFPAYLPQFTRDLPNGRTLHFQRRRDDCLRAALATVCGLPYEDCIDLAGKPGTSADERDRYARLVEWAYDHGWRLRFHTKPPEGIDTFVAVCVPDGERYRHVLAVVDGKVCDPASGWLMPVIPGVGRVKLAPPGNVEYIFNFERRD